MRYERVLLLRQNTRGMFYAPRRPPVGIGYLAESLLRHNIKYAIIDRELGHTIEDIMGKIAAFNPDLVGISMVSLGYKKAYEMIQQIKNEFKVDIAIGGPHTSAFQESTLEECSEIDFASISESDETIVELCHGKTIENIEGLYYRQNGKVVFSGKRRPIADIDSLAFPTYTGFEMDRYLSKEMGILTSRGCPFGCTFCAVHSIMGAKIRMRSVDSVMSEIQYWYDRGYKTFLVMDDNFTFNRQRVLDICAEIESRKLDIQISLANGVRADKVDEYMLKRLRDVGAWEVQIAVESANDRVLKLLNKGETLDVIRKAVDMACRLNYDVGLNFLIGSPGETWLEVHNSFKFVDHYPIQLAFFFNIIPYPGTRMFDYLKNNHLLRADPVEYLGTIREGVLRPLFETPELSLKQRKKLLGKARKTSEKVRRRYLRRRLTKLGPLAWIPAFLGSWHFTAVWLKRNKIVSKYLLPIYYKSRKTLSRSPEAEDVCIRD
ncbi:radical SAM protein [candidate division KSB1 bacterium]|nr:radical SAM protein [candidate division KSB1 bacterium]